MASSISTQVATTVEAALPRIQQDVLLAGPLRGFLPADIRADFLRVFTQVLCRAIYTGDGEELGSLVDEVVWEARKMGVAPHLLLGWIDRYSTIVHGVLDDRAWKIVEPLLALARRHIERLQN